MEFVSIAGPPLLDLPELGHHMFGRRIPLTIGFRPRQGCQLSGEGFFRRKFPIGPYQVCLWRILHGLHTLLDCWASSSLVGECPRTLSGVKDY
jgi:hypothetical protein